MFIGIGTLVNTLAVFVGGGMGIIFKKALKSTIQDTMMKAMGMEDIMTPQAGADQKYVKTTTVKDGDKNLTCEEYKTDDGVVTKFYFEGKKWVRQETIDGDTISICEIKDFKGTVDNSIFDLNGYTKLDEKALAAMGGGM